MTQHKDAVRYEERAGGHLNEAATVSLRKDTSRKGEVDYEVDCPTCHGTVLVTEYPGGTYRVVPATNTQVDLHPPGPRPVPVVYMGCGCDKHHPGAPQGTTGCGSLWVVPA